MEASRVKRVVKETQIYEKNSDICNFVCFRFAIFKIKFYNFFNRYLSHRTSHRREASDDFLAVKNLFELEALKL